MTLLKVYKTIFAPQSTLHVPFRVGNHDNNFIVDYDVGVLLWV